MNNSIYHFFSHLVVQKTDLASIRHLDKFRFDASMLSCKSKGKSPDLAIRLNAHGNIFSGGELVELKDSASFSVSSFNSTIPTGSKPIADLIMGKNNIIRDQMKKIGDDIESLPIRDVFYLVRGRKKKAIKICLVHGKFFETVPGEMLISDSFRQAFEERMKEAGEEFSQEFKEKITKLFSHQDTFSKVRTVTKASVRLRFRIMTEVLAEGNILNSTKYPQIKDNTLNFLIPCHSTEEENLHRKRMKQAFSEFGVGSLLKNFDIFTLKHLLNGPFLVFQTAIK
ncbi:MAG: hypothetical protein ABSC53_07110 [Bacteroidota bacterium]